jgi:hypothetical protein
MADRGLRLPDAGFEVILRILKAYLAAAKNQAGVPVKLDDVVRRAGGGRTQVSGQNGFLASVGLIEGGNTKQLTELGRRVALAADHPASPEWGRAFADVVDSSDDLAGIVDSVRVRKEMTLDDLVSHIVLTAGVAKNSRSLTGARTVLEVLKAGGAITEADGTLRAAAPRPADDTETNAHTMPPEQRAPADTAVPPIASRSHGPTSMQLPSPAGAPIHIHVWLNASGTEAGDVADVLREFLEKLTSSGE